MEKFIDDFVADPNLLAVFCREKIIPAHLAYAFFKKVEEVNNPQSIVLMKGYDSKKHYRREGELQTLLKNV